MCVLYSKRTAGISLKTILKEKIQLFYFKQIEMGIQIHDTLVKKVT